ncbi:contact-dependent growth inhibition system immunity protein [Streptomyces sp. TRM70350]|uniref:contact-dependent growth inhibition system immunity protein n=1 Tax=Streptomyces sp. TRM70350 TaxID=2856165 RepID=UPI001C43EF8F|nr:hypothetical protein [Streptomyces sp. TRM70350]
MGPSTSLESRTGDGAAKVRWPHGERRDAAVDDYRGGTEPRLVARVAGELHELLALDLDESGYALAVAELGMEVDPPAPYAPSGWLARVAERLAAPRADYGPPAAAD